MEQCFTHHKTILNPIIDWDDAEVWEFIHEYHVPYCELYDKGYKRLGCIGCPMNTHRAEELERYPGYKRMYLKAFEKMLTNYEEHPSWKNPNDVMAWWLGDKQSDPRILDELPIMKGSINED